MYYTTEFYNNLVWRDISMYDKLCHWVILMHWNKNTGLDTNEYGWFSPEYSLAVT